MFNEEKKLSVVLALCNLKLEEINLIMSLVKNKKEVMIELINWLNETDEKDASIILNKTTEMLDAKLYNANRLKKGIIYLF